MPNLSKQMVFVFGFIVGAITVSSLALIQVKLRDHVPECSIGKPVPPGGCITEIKPAH